MLVLYIILIIIALVLILALVVSRDANYEKSILIDAGIEKVWKNTNSLAAMDRWSPWNARDPQMERTLTGTDGQPGACQSWVSKNKNVGEGSQTILAVAAPKRLDTRLDFVKPFKSTANAYVVLSEDGNGTKATWGFRSRMPYPMNLMKLFMNFEKSMDKDFGTGLGRLKDLSEKES